MATPLSTLRKYQFGFFVFFGVVCMLVFVVGDPLDSWLRSRSSAGSRSENKVVVSWRGGELRENEIGYTQSVRNVIREFIRTLLEETRKKNGSPRVQMLSLSPSEEDIVYTHLLAQRAEAMGMVVSDETALIYLEQLTANLIPRDGIGSIFQEAVAGRVTEQQLLAEIKTELLAQNYLSLTYPDLTQGQLPVQAWEYHRRLNRRVKAEVVPVPVANFKSKVTRQPTDTEIEVLYSEGKERYPDPTSPDPGFKRPRKAAFDFVRADRKKFEEEETAKLKPLVTDQEIQTYYEKNKQEFRIPDAPPEKPKPDATSPDGTKPEGTKPDAAKPGDPAAAPPADKPPEKSTPEKLTPEKTPPAPDAPKPEEKKPEEKKSEEKKPAETKPEVQPPVDKPAVENVEEKKDDKPLDQPKLNNGEPDSACGDDQVVDQAAAETDDKDAPPPAEKPADPAEKKVDDAPPPTENTATEKPATEEPATEKATTEKKEAATAKEGAKDNPPAAATTPTSPPATPPATVAPAPEKPDATPPVDPATSPPAAATPEPKYKPFEDTLKEEIREKIAKQKAAQAAQQRIEKGFDEIKRAVEKYARELRSAELTGKPVPSPLDLIKVAQSHGMTAGSLPLADPNKIQETELGKTSGYDFSSMSFEPIPFHGLAYRDGIPLWKPDQIRGSNAGGNPDVEFLYWKTKEEDPFVPDLKDIRAEVVEAWKLREALVLAETEAKSIAEKARQGGKPLKEAFADNKELQVAETNPFTWMTRGFLPANMGGAPMLSSVENVDNPGQDFMRSVFTLQTGEIGTAVNQPRTVVYVVRIESESPSEDVLREQFLQSGSSEEVRHIAYLDRMEIRRSWFETLRREMNVKWERTPQS